MRGEFLRGIRLLTLVCGNAGYVDVNFRPGSNFSVSSYDATATLNYTIAIRRSAVEL